ncbi:MAG: hypothetical protein AAFX96_07110, partial [Pseudomonadota bacterium]
MTEFPPDLSPLLIKQAVEAALLEDLGRAGDITTNATIPENAVATCVLATRDDGIVSGVVAFVVMSPALPKSSSKAASTACLINNGERSGGNSVIQS